MRRRIKAMTYGLVYGLSAFGLSNQLKISREEAQAQMDLYFSRFGGVREYLRRVVDTARIEGYTETLLGRRRYIPDLTSDNRQRRELAERNALNAPIQGSAADLIKVAMLKVDARIKAEGLRSRLLLQVHDELVAEVAPGEQDAIATVLREEMGSAYQLDVPLDVSIGVGTAGRRPLTDSIRGKCVRMMSARCRGAAQPPGARGSGVRSHRHRADHDPSTEQSHVGTVATAVVVGAVIVVIV